MAYNPYHEGKIYRIRSPSNPDIHPYYGSTIQNLHQRFNIHKWYADKTFGNSSKILINCGDAIIELIENYQCESKYELECRERWYIENNPCINKNIPTRTKQEYKEKITKQKKEILHIKNKDKITKQKYLCICGKSYPFDAKKSHERGLYHIVFIICPLANSFNMS